MCSSSESANARAATGTALHGAPGMRATAPSGLLPGSEIVERGERLGFQIAHVDHAGLRALVLDTRCSGRAGGSFEREPGRASLRAARRAAALHPAAPSPRTGTERARERGDHRVHRRGEPMPGRRRRCAESVEAAVPPTLPPAVPNGSAASWSCCPGRSVRSGSGGSSVSSKSGARLVPAGAGTPSRNAGDEGLGAGTPSWSPGQAALAGGGPLVGGRSARSGAGPPRPRSPRPATRTRAGSPSSRRPPSPAGATPRRLDRA